MWVWHLVLARASGSGCREEIDRGLRAWGSGLLIFDHPRNQHACQSAAIFAHAPLYTHPESLNLILINNKLAVVDRSIEVVARGPRRGLMKRSVMTLCEDNGVVGDYKP